MSRSWPPIVLVALACLAPGCGNRSAARAVIVPSALSPVSGGAEASGTSTAPPQPVPPALLSPSDLDALMAAYWRQARVTPAPPASDAEFLRRVTLDLAGRIPTLDEAESFLASVAADKRTRLVDGLLTSGDYAEHWGDVYLDLFVGRQFRRPGLEKKLTPRSYFVRAFQENRPFDQVTRELLTFSGEILPDGPGVFLASHLKGGGPETAASVTARLFLGLQIQCAQCHDHPTDARYKQEDFYGLVAYFARTQEKQQNRGQAPPPSVPDQPEMQGAAPLPDAAAAKPGALEKAYFVLDKPRGAAKFKKSGSDHDVVVAPRFLGRAVTALDGESLRATLARTVVASDLFAKAMVDRTWAQLFGTGLVEPWDDLGGEGDPNHPSLLKRLADDFRASRFDVRHLLRTLILSRAYGLTSRVPAPVAAAAAAVAPGDLAAVQANPATAAFARGAVRRLTPEQLFHSLLVATGAARMEGKTADEMEKKIGRLMKECLFVFGDDERAEINTFNGNIPQALLLWNGDIVNDGVRARPGGTLARILAGSAQPAERLRRMFLAAFARPPTETETARLLPTLPARTGAKHGAGAPQAYEDLFFALLTSSEMLTIH